jgi:hypothetical protein
MRPPPTANDAAVPPEQRSEFLLLRFGLRRNGRCLSQHFGRTPVLRLSLLLEIQTAAKREYASIYGGTQQNNSDALDHLFYNRTQRRYCHGKPYPPHQRAPASVAVLRSSLDAGRAAKTRARHGRPPAGRAPVPAPFSAPCLKQIPQGTEQAIRTHASAGCFLLHHASSPSHPVLPGEGRPVPSLPAGHRHTYSNAPASSVVHPHSPQAQPA